MENYQVEYSVQSGLEGEELQITNHGLSDGSIVWSVTLRDHGKTIAIFHCDDFAHADRVFNTLNATHIYMG